MSQGGGSHSRPSLHPRLMGNGSGEAQLLAVGSWRGSGRGDGGRETVPGPCSAPWSSGDVACLKGNFGHTTISRGHSGSLAGALGSPATWIFEQS